MRIRTLVLTLIVVAFGAVGTWRYVLAHGPDVDGNGAVAAPDIFQVIGAFGTLIPPTSCGGIQDAIDALPPGGGQVLVPAGTYVCSDPVVIDRDNVDLRGEGPATVLRLSDGANAPVLVAGQTIAAPAVTRSNIRISSLTIDGNRMNQSEECWGGSCATNPIHNNGITLRRVDDVLIEDVTVFSARSGGLVTERGSRRVVVRGFTAYDNQFDGLAGYQTENSIFSNLMLTDNLAAGLSFDIDFNQNIISDAVISGSGTVGIFMRDSVDNVFHGLQIRNSAQHGIFLAQVDSDPVTAASGNTFEAMVVSTSGAYGLRANDASVVNTLLLDSQFVGNTGECISEAVQGQVHVSSIVCR